MKPILIAMSFITVCGCRVEKDIQVEFVKAELIRIDTIGRFPKERKQLTWQDQDKIRYTSYMSIDKPISVGLQMLVMRRR